LNEEKQLDWDCVAMNEKAYKVLLENTGASARNLAVLSRYL